MGKRGSINVYFYVVFIIVCLMQGNSSVDKNLKDFETLL